MRAYFFGNVYLSSIQQGIQAAHVLAEIFIKYSCENTIQNRILMDWAHDHKTMILLNGGYSESIRELYRFFDTNQNLYPFANFNEGIDALDDALTSVGFWSFFNGDNLYNVGT